MKNITFLFPCSAPKPVGGFKVVYEYANRLVQDNYFVHIVYASELFPKEFPLWKKLWSRLLYVKRKCQKRYLPVKWFNLDPRVKQHFVYSLNQNNVSASDIYVSTSWETAEYLMNYQDLSVSKNFYLIQSYEDWSCNDEQRLLVTWRAPLHKIVIASWLKDIANKIGESADVVENGFDFDDFRVTIGIRERCEDRIIMLYHEMESKGIKEALSALDLVKHQFPNLSVNIFGVYSRPENLPDWYIYYQMPDKETLNRIYNEAAIYVGASHREGWALTVGEAMQCGCAVVCTDIAGYAVLAHHGETALLSPVKDENSLAMNVIKLLENQELRIKLAEKGNQYIQQYTWKRAYQKLKKVLLKDE